MKNVTLLNKWSVLLIAGFASLSFQAAATVVISEDFSKCTAGSLSSASSTDFSSSMDTYMNTPGWTAFKIYQAGGSVKFGNSTSVNMFIETPTINLSAFSGTFYLSFDATAWSGDSTHLQIFLDGVLVKDVYGLSNTSPYVLSEFGPFQLTGGTATSKVKISGLNSAKTRFFLDNIVIEQMDPNAPRAALIGANYVTETGKPLSKEVSLTAYNLTGDLTVALENLRGSDFTTTVSTVTAAQALAGFAIPVLYSPTVAGTDTATLTISGGGLTAPVSTTLTGEGWTPVEIASMSALRAAHAENLTDTKTIYRLTREVLVSFKHTSGNTKFVQDATGGACIYDVSGNITTSLNVGDAVLGLTGTLVNYSGLMEFIPVEDIASVASTGNFITPAVLTLDEAHAQKERYEGTVVVVNNVTTTATGNFAASKNYTFKNGEDTILLRTTYSGLDYIGTALPTAAINLTGLLTEYNSTPQLVPRTSADMVLYTGLTKKIVQPSFVSGSNGVLNVRTVQGASIEVFNMVGKRVLNTKANEGVNTFTLTSDQLYIVRVDGRTAKVIL